MKKNKYLDKFNKTTFFLSLLILVLLYILYIHNTNYNNLFENFSLITNDFVNPCDEGYPQFYTDKTKTPAKPDRDEISCNHLCNDKDNCKFYTISGGVCHIYDNNIDYSDISVNCNGKNNIISDIGDKYIGIGFIRDIDKINELKYHDDHLTNINTLLNNRHNIDNGMEDIKNKLTNNIDSINTDNFNTINNIDSGKTSLFSYLTPALINDLCNATIEFTEGSFNTYLTNIYNNRGYSGDSYYNNNFNERISNDFLNPDMMIKQKQNTKNIEQTNKHLEDYTKKKTRFVYMLLMILIILTAIILTLYFIVPNIITDLILIIYFIGIFSILFYLKGYL